jgi:HEAT repeat protein
MVKKKEARHATKEEKSMAAVQAAQSKLQAEAGELGPIYDTCSHAWVMIRETAVEELTDSLRDGNKNDREVALKELLGQVRHSPVKYIREQSAKGLGSVAAKNPAIRDAVMELLDDEDAGVREAAVIALRQRLQSKEMVQALNDAQKGVIEAFELEKPMIEKIHSLIADVNGRVRFNAIDSLSSLVKMFHADSIVAITTRLRDEEGWVRHHAAEMVNVALKEAQEVKKSLPKSSLVFISEGYDCLMFASQQCYDIGLQVLLPSSFTSFVRAPSTSVSNTHT